MERISEWGGAAGWSAREAREVKEWERRVRERGVWSVDSILSFE